MKQVDRITFYQALATFQVVPFCQWPGWIDAQATNRRELLYLLDEDVAMVGHLKRRAGFSYLMLQAPALRHEDVKVSTISAFYQEVRNLADIVEINDLSVYNPEQEVAIRQAGFVRPVGSFSYQLTNLIDLTQPIHWDSNWSRHLKKVEGLSLEILTNPGERDIADYMALYKSMCTSKQITLPYTAEFIQRLLSDAHFLLFFEKDGQDERVALLLIHTSGTHAGLLYAATSDEGRDMHAGFAIYRDVLAYLAGQGYTSFDMEKMGASLHSTNAVFQFKQGIKGALTPLNGEWQWCKRSWMPVAMYFMKKYIWKRTQA